MLWVTPDFLAEGNERKVPVRSALPSSVFRGRPELQILLGPEPEHPCSSHFLHQDGDICGTESSTDQDPQPSLWPFIRDKLLHSPMSYKLFP